MADSDDDFNESKFRDKFKRERNEFESRVKKSKPLEDNDRGKEMGHGSYRKRHYDNKGFDRSDSPHQKRFRKFPNDFGGKRQRNDRNEETNFGSPRRNLTTISGTTDPNRSSFTDNFSRIQSFKSYVLTLDDNVFPDQAVAAYMEYVKEFSDKQVHPFFDLYNKCDWMVLKYHPFWKVHEDIFDRKCRKVRLSAFLKLDMIFSVSQVKLDDDKTHKDQFKFLLLINAILEGGSESAISDLASSIDSFNNNAEADDDVEEDDDLEGKMFNKITSSANSEPQIEGPHKTVSFYVRSIPIRVSRAELIDAYEKVPGFIRIYLSEPVLGRRDHRCACLTFRNNVDSRATLLDLNNIMIQETVRLPVRPNFDTFRKVKVQILKDGFYMTREHLLFDVEMVIKLTKRLDELYGVFSNLPKLPKKQEEQNNEGAVTEEPSETEFVWKSSIVDFDETFEESSLPDNNHFLASLQELQQKPELSELSIQAIADILDPVILYLRVVHGVDYYSGQEFPWEHCRDVRCSLLTVRQKIYDSNDVLPHNFKTKDENYSLYVDECEAKFDHLLHSKQLSDEDARVIGLKDPDQEVEAFIQKNTVKKDENRYLCPLSNKKFKTQDFVRKHILTKHFSKIERVKTEALFFNNFLRDKYKNLPFNPELMKRGIWSSFNATHSKPQEYNKDYGNRANIKRGFKRTQYKDLDAPGGGLFGV